MWWQRWKGHTESETVGAALSTMGPFSRDDGERKQSDTESIRNPSISCYPMCCTMRVFEVRLTMHALLIYRNVQPNYRALSEDQLQMRIHYGFE